MLSDLVEKNLYHSILHLQDQKLFDLPLLHLYLHFRLHLRFHLQQKHFLILLQMMQNFLQKVLLLQILNYHLSFPTWHHHVLPLHLLPSTQAEIHPLLQALLQNHQNLHTLKIRTQKNLENLFDFHFLLNTQKVLQ